MAASGVVLDDPAVLPHEVYLPVDDGGGVQSMLPLNAWTTATTPCEHF